MEIVQLQWVGSYVSGHVFKTSLPFRRVELCVAEPGVLVVASAAPFAFGHVIVKMHVDTLFGELGSDCVIYLKVQY